MEMPGRRSNYSLLSQNPDDPQPPPPQLKFLESLSGDKSKAKPGAGFDWPSDGGGRIGQLLPSSLQRQSSGSSFGESSLSGEYYLPTLSGAAAGESELYGPAFDGAGGFFRGGGGESGDGRINLVVPDSGGPAGGSSSSKSWAQQTEESYQLQLALALRLSSEATCADDPNFLSPRPDDSMLGPPVPSAESVSHRFWVRLLRHS